MHPTDFNRNCFLVNVHHDCSLSGHGFTDLFRVTGLCFPEQKLMLCINGTLRYFFLPTIASQSHLALCKLE